MCINGVIGVGGEAGLQLVAAAMVGRDFSGHKAALRGIALGVALVAAVLSGVGPARADEGIRAEYSCKGRFDATAVTAFFFNQAPSAVVLLVGESARRLPQAMGASGARYASGEESFWIKGDTATWQLGATPAYVCESVSPPGRGTAGAVKRP